MLLPPLLLLLHGDLWPQHEDRRVELVDRTPALVVGEELHVPSDQKVQEAQYQEQEAVRQYPM